MHGALLYLKNKQFFAKRAGIYRVLGSFSMVRELAERYQLLHIIDLDLNKGNAANMNVYEELTYYVHTQVGINARALGFAGELQALHVRLVVKPELYRSSMNPDFLAFSVDSEKEKGLIEKLLPKRPIDVVIRDEKLLEAFKQPAFRVFFITEKPQVRTVFCLIRPVTGRS